MRSALLERPDPTEYAPYYSRYVAHVPEGDILELLAAQITDTTALLRSAGEALAGHRYAPGKWSVREMVGHLSDTERIMAYRALRIARADTTPLPGFEQDDYVATARFEARTLSDLIAEFESVRAATLSLCRSLDDTALRRRGIASGFDVSARALVFIIAGHERHHMSVLRSRYLPG